MRHAAALLPLHCACLPRRPPRTASALRGTAATKLRYAHRTAGFVDRFFSFLCCGLLAWIGLACVFPMPARAHSFLPVQLLLEEISPERWLARWAHGPLVQPLPLSVALPPFCEPREILFPNSAQVHCSPPGLAEASLRFHLGGAAPELWVRAAFSDGRQLAGPVSPQSGEFFLFHPDRLPLVRLLLLYGRLGVAHILEGWDHLLFLLGLLLGTSSFRGVALSVTAFTLAHSLSLALLALTSVTVFQPGVEVLIALSLVLVARERWLQKEARPQRSRRDAALAFGFGLVHGLGFGTALRELGVPERALLWALGSFNVGVELGQMACVVAAIPLLELWRHRAAEHVLWRQAPALLVGAAGAYWTLQRAPALWGG